MAIDKDLKLYETLINEKSLVDATDILPNAGKYHAAIAMSKLLDKTQHYVKMVVGSFDGEISNQHNYIKSLEGCIDRNVNFEIIFLDTPNKESKAYKILNSAKEKGKKIAFEKATRDFVKQLSRDGDTKHFSVYDDKMFRFEKDTKNYLALFSFNDTSLNKILSNIFDTEFQKVTHAIS